MSAPDWASFGDAVERQPDARRDRAAPQTNVEYQAGQIAQVSIPLDKVPADEAMWRLEIARVTGLTVPDTRRVELAQVRFWGNPEAPNVYCRFLIVDREDTVGRGADAVALLRELRRGRRKPRVTASSGDGAFVLAFSDWQTGKREGGGTPALAERLHTAFDAAEARVTQLNAQGRNLGHLVIVGAGDMIENCAVFQNQPFELDGDRRTQIRNTVTFILAGLDQLAPMFAKVTVLAVGGNHGEHRIQGKRVNRHDNDDVAVFEHAALATQRDPALKHVKFIIAQDELAKTVQVGPWILGATHGHVFGRGAGGAAAKARRWFEGQAAGRHPVGDSDVLLTGHYHHLSIQDWGSCLHVQNPALDGGSPFFTDGTGQYAGPGMLSWVMNNTHRFTDMQIL